MGAGDTSSSCPHNPRHTSCRNQVCAPASRLTHSSHTKPPELVLKSGELCVKAEQMPAVLHARCSSAAARPDPAACAAVLLHAWCSQTIQLIHGLLYSCVYPCVQAPVPQAHALLFHVVPARGLDPKHGGLSCCYRRRHVSHRGASRSRLSSARSSGMAGSSWH